jgi:hypothetical protein
VDAGVLKDSLKRVNLFAARQHPPIPVKLAFSHAEGTPSGGELTISVQSSEMGGATERIAADVPEGKSFEITFNPAYLMDGVATAGAEKVVFRLNEPLKPAILRGAEKHGADEDGPACGAGWRGLGADGTHERLNDARYEEDLDGFKRALQEYLRAGARAFQAALRGQPPEGTAPLSQGPYSSVGR